jgi:carbonic anhydrase
MKTNQLRLHGWWFDIAQADVYRYEPALNQFIVIGN